MGGYPVVFLANKYNLTHVVYENMPDGKNAIPTVTRDLIGVS